MLNNSLLIATISDNVYILIIPINTSLKENDKKFQLSNCMVCYVSKNIIKDNRTLYFTLTKNRNQLLICSTVFSTDTQK